MRLEEVLAMGLLGWTLGEFNQWWKAQGNRGAIENARAGDDGSARSADLWDALREVRECDGIVIVHVDAPNSPLAHYLVTREGDIWERVPPLDGRRRS